MDIERFAKLYMEAIRQAGETRKLVCDPEQSCLKVPGDPGMGMSLGNIYMEYCTSPEEAQTEVLRRFVRAWFDLQKANPDEFAAASHDLLPIIRSCFFFEADVLRTELERKKSLSVLYQRIGENIAIGLAFDRPDTIHTIYQDDLDRWGVTFHEALEVARNNLHAMPFHLEKDNGIYLTVTQDNYDASRLLLLDAIRRLRVKGDVVAMVPNRDSLIVTGSHDVKGIRRMVALAKVAFRQARPISGLALRLDGDKWVSWMPDCSHPAYQDFQMMQVDSYALDYNAQKDLLDMLHTAKQEDVFVAPFRVGQDTTTGEFVTFCVWSRGVLTLLPCTEAVAFVQEDRELLTVAWDRVMETVGYMMEPLKMYPARWRVADFPTEQQMEAMK